MTLMELSEADRLLWQKLNHYRDNPGVAELQAQLLQSPETTRVKVLSYIYGNQRTLRGK